MAAELFRLEIESLSLSLSFSLKMICHLYSGFHYKVVRV